MVGSMDMVGCVMYIILCHLPVRKGTLFSSNPTYDTGIQASAVIVLETKKSQDLRLTHNLHNSGVTALAVELPSQLPSPWEQGGGGVRYLYTSALGAYI